MGENAARENFSFIVKTIITLSSCRSFIIIILVFKFTPFNPNSHTAMFHNVCNQTYSKGQPKAVIWDLARRGHSCKHWFKKVPKKQHVRNRVFSWIGAKVYKDSLGWNKQCFHRYWRLYTFWECISTSKCAILVIIYDNSCFLNYISQFKILLFIKYLCNFLLYVTTRGEIKNLVFNCDIKDRNAPYGHMRLSLSFPCRNFPLIFRMKWTESQLLFPTIIHPGKAIKKRKG